MPPFPPPSHSPVAITLIIVVAALIALGMLLRWQHDRQRLAVLKLAIEKGVTHLPAALPMWLSSLRQGIMLATLGVALLIVGGVAVAMAHGHGPQLMQPWGAMGPGPQMMRVGHGNGQRAASIPPPGARLGFGPPANGKNPPPLGGANGPGNAGREFGPPGGFPPRSVMGPRYQRFPPPGMQQQKMLGLGSLAIGFILTLLGATRIAFANIERKYFVADESQSSDFPNAPDVP